MQIIKPSQHNKSEIFEPPDDKVEDETKKKGTDDELSETHRRVFPKRYLYAYEKTYSSTTKESYVPPNIKKTRSSPSQSPSSSPKSSQRKKPLEPPCSKLFTANRLK